MLYANPASASAALIVVERRVLLIRRRIEPFRGDWALPAGYQEMDEAPERTAEREAREEAGVDVRATSLVDLLFVPDDPRKPANVAVFRCLWRGGEPRPGDDAEEARWFDLDALPENIGFENNRRILDRLARGDGYAEGLFPTGPTGGEGPVVRGSKGLELPSSRPLTDAGSAPDPLP